MIKFLSRIFAYLWSLANNTSVIASARNGISTVADLMIVSNLAGKEPFLKFGEMVFYVPKKCVGVAKYIYDFLSEHKVISTGLLVLLGFSLFSVFRMQLVREGIKNGYEFLRNLIFDKKEMLEDKELQDEIEKFKNIDPESIPKLANAISQDMLNGQSGVPLKFSLDFDNSGEVTVQEYFRGRRIERVLSRCQPEMLELLQFVAEYNVDFPELLKYYGYYFYEKDYKNSIS